jgi:hypothetical protein
VSSDTRGAARIPGATYRLQFNATFGFKDDPRLTDDEQALLAAWLDQGALEGAPATRPLPKPAQTSLQHPEVGSDKKMR